MKVGKYLLISVDYDSEELEVNALDDINEVHEYFSDSAAEEIIKDRRYKSAFEEAILVSINTESYFKGIK